MDALTGIVLLAVFGGLFVMTCIISSVKAVRDRKRIKQRISERKIQNLEQSTSKSSNCPVKASIEEKTSTSITIDHTRNSDRKKKQTTNGKIVSDTSLPLSISCLDVPVPYSYKNGLDNLTYAHSQTNIESGNHEQNAQTKSKTTAAELSHPQSHVVSKRTRSDDGVETREKKRLTHLPPECLAVQKILRRHSYEMAVCEHSWLPMMDPPSFASSEAIANSYNYGCGPKGKTSVACFENKAFDRDDHKKT